MQQLNHSSPTGDDPAVVTWTTELTLSGETPRVQMLRGWCRGLQFRRRSCSSSPNFEQTYRMCGDTDLPWSKPKNVDGISFRVDFPQEHSQGQMHERSEFCIKAPRSDDVTPVWSWMPTKPACAHAENEPDQIG